MNDFRDLMKDLAHTANELKQWLTSIDWRAVHETMEYLSNRLPANLEQESIQLMNRGWFIWFFDGVVPDFVEKSNSLIGKSSADQDSYMCNYITDNISYFESELCHAHPNRACQIKDAFKSHTTELFYASIPAFLVLSEGIGRDLFPGVGIYAKQKRKSLKGGPPETDKIFDSVPGLNAFEEAVLKPLRVSSDLTKSISSPTEHEHKLLNRHLIMHGNSSLYGSKENSLKAISLAFFVHKSLEHIKNTSKV